MSLVAVVRDQFVNKDQVIEDEELLDGISLASILPGPVAVNVVAYLGNKLRGIPGALVSMLGVLIPSLILILTLSYLYLEHGEVKYVPEAFAGILPAVCAIIVATAWRMSQKSVKNWKQWLLVFASGATLILLKGFWVTLSIIAAGAIVGIILFREPNTHSLEIIAKKQSSRRSLTGIIILVASLFAISGMLFLFPDKLLQELYLTMSGMSVALFGGGYVFLPVMQQVIVDNMGWLNEQEFVDCIAMGQITPGPIMISATFIGYKVYGLWGAAIATLGMFMPPATLMLIASTFFAQIKNNRWVVAAFKGIRPAVIGMIFVAAYVIAKSTDVYWQSVLIFLIALGVSLFTKTQLALTILGSAIVGILVF